MLERLAAEFAGLGSADEVRGDIEQHRLSLGVSAQRILGARALADIEGHEVVSLQRHGHLARLLALNGCDREHNLLRRGISLSLSL